MTNTSSHIHLDPGVPPGVLYGIDPGIHTHNISPHTHTHTFTTPDVPLKLGFGPITISEEMARDFLTRDALEEEVKKAERSLKQELTETLWGTYAPAITEQINRPSMIATMLEAQERKNMDTNTAILINDEVAKRKAKKARKKVRKAYAAFDGMGLDEADYAVWTWNHTFKGKDTVYEYVALYVNERWYVTGRTGPDGIDTDEFVGWLVGKEFDPETFVNVA